MAVLPALEALVFWGSIVLDYTLFHKLIYRLPISLLLKLSPSWLHLDLTVIYDYPIHLLHRRTRTLNRLELQQQIVLLAFSVDRHYLPEPLEIQLDVIIGSLRVQVPNKNLVLVLYPIAVDNLSDLLIHPANF
jgi:hypothetical protein